MQCEEEPKGCARLGLRLERTADVAGRACLALEHVRERTGEHAIQVARPRSEQIGQGGQMQVVFDRLQRGSPFRVGSYIVLFLLQLESYGGRGPSFKLRATCHAFRMNRHNPAQSHAATAIMPKALAADDAGLREERP